MDRQPRFRFPWRNRRQIERDFESELDFHLRMRAEELVESGMSPEEAAAEARRQFGDISGARRYVRSMDSGRERGRRLAILWDELVQDVRYGLRRLAKAPAFTILAVTTLAIGIGANAAVFSLVEAFLLDPVPMEDVESVVSVFQIQPPDPTHGTLSYPDLDDLRRGTTDVFSGVSSVRYAPIPIELGGEHRVLAGSAVTANYFTLAGIQPHLGRLFGPEDGVAPGAHPVVVFGYRFWAREMGGDPGVIGSQVRIAGRAYTVVGVTPADFKPLRVGGADAYVPMMMLEELGPYSDFDARNNHSQIVRARLRPGVGMVQAQAAVDAVAEGLKERWPDSWNPGDRFQLVSAQDVILTPDVDPYLDAAGLMLTGVVGLLLMLACTNLAGFLLARAVDRRKEIGLRMALGATRRTVMTQLLTESALLGVAGGVVGIALAYGLLALMGSAEIRIGLPISLDPEMNGTVLGYALLLSGVTGLFLGLVPAWTTRKTELGTALRNESAGGGARGHARWRSVMVVSQLAISSVLLVGAGLFLRSFQEILTVDPGFGREPTATIAVMLPNELETDSDRGRQMTSRLVERYRSIPGVEAVGLISRMPLDLIGSSSSAVNVPGVEPPPGLPGFTADRREIGPDLLEAAGIRLLRGRSFRPDDDEDAAPVVIVSEELERRFFGEDGAVGRTLLRETAGGAEEMLVVGVVEDVKMRTMAEAPRPVIYQPLAQSYQPFFVAMARTSGNADALVSEMAEASREVDGRILVWDAKTVAQHMDVQRLPARISALLLSVFAVLGLALAAIGLYGVVSYAVAQRTREAGIRLALGADARSVVRLLTGGGVRLVVVGALVGIALSVAVSRLLSSLLFGVESAGLGVATAALLTMMATGVLAAYLPARRASRVDPVEALRSE